MAPRFHGTPTNRSQRVTLEQDCPELVARCKADEVDAVILVPNCPVCHQTVSLAARMLEENGIATVVMGCAKDIVEHVGAPRFLFSDFPLGNAAGRPHDPDSCPAPENPHPGQRGCFSQTDRRLWDSIDGRVRRV